MTVDKNAVDNLREKIQENCPGLDFNISATRGSELIVVERAEGTRLWDLDGSEYIDYACAYGPNILGHRHPEYIKALHQLIDTTAICVGGFFGLSEHYLSAVEKIIRYVPCAERVKFLVSGSEAVQSAIRIARSYTKRPYVLMFQDQYHGWIDNVAGLDVSPLEGKPIAALHEAGSLGRGAQSAQETLMIEWNNIEALEATLETYGDEIAIIMMEAFASNAGGRIPRPGYLEQVRKLCDQYGIVLCFDEVLTGFRIGLNGAQGVFGVTPDLCTLGKALGGGMPISAVVGKSGIMDVMKDGTTHCYGTYMGHSLAVEAVNASLAILGHDSGAVYRQMEQVQQRLMSGLGEIAQRRQIPLRVQGFAGLFNTLFGVDPDREQYSRADSEGLDHQLAMKFTELIKLQGISCATGRWLPTIVHTDQETDIALEAADKAMAQL